MQRVGLTVSLFFRATKVLKYTKHATLVSWAFWLSDQSINQSSKQASKQAIKQINRMCFSSKIWEAISYSWKSTTSLKWWFLSNNNKTLEKNCWNSQNQPILQNIGGQQLPRVSHSLYDLCIYIYIWNDIYIPRTQITLVFIGKGLVLDGWSPKIEDIHRFQVYIYIHIYVTLIYN